ncbi:MAG: insulinase family protein [Clostridiales bacterium]|nr:insulinase family protein [Clostridiales bacterium]
MKVFTLTNGIRVAMENLPHLRSISVGFWIGAGCYAETENNSGISHFIEHMLFKGTKNRTAMEIANCIDSLGGQLNAFTSKECTCYYVNILNEHYGVAIDLLCDMLINSKLDEQDIQREKGVVIEEISMVEDTPDELAHENLAKAYYGNHTLGKTILGTKETVSAITNAHMRTYMNETYTAQNIVISVAGSFDEQAILSMLEEKLAPLSKNQSKPAKAPELSTPKGDIIFINKDIEQVNLCLGLPGVKQTSEDYFAQSIIGNIFGGGMSSRLFQRVREQNGMTYSIYSYLSTSVNSGMLTIYAGMNPSQSIDVFELIVDEANKMLDKGITEKEFIEGKEQLKGSFVLGLESGQARMHRNGKVLLLNDKVLTVDDVISSINAITIEDISKNIRQMFDLKKISASCVGKIQTGDKLFNVINALK